MRKLILLLYLLFLFGCSQSIPNKEKFIIKEKTITPSGWTDYCKDHPEDPFCKEK
jgi:hypothetical protein